MVENLLIYFVTKGPVRYVTNNGEEVWQVEARVSNDNGETCAPMVFTFETEEYAVKFTREVNYKMEPTRLGGDEDE